MRLTIATAMRWRRSLKRMVRRHWRHTAPLALALMVVSGLVMVWNSRVGQLGVAASELWIMTVPCGIAVVNKKQSAVGDSTTVFRSTRSQHDSGSNEVTPNDPAHRPEASK